MRIGFDAKRAFYNRSGLGNYSRDLIYALCRYYPENIYHLYTPTLKNSLSFPEAGNVFIETLHGRPGKLQQAYWRSFLLSGRLKKDKVEVFHGLSNELPAKIRNTGIKSVVSIHDLIFMRHPEWYNPFDVAIYKRKFKYSCHIADRIIAISNQTKEDIVSYFDIEKTKIEVIYQGCNEAFRQKLNNDEKKVIKERWNLPGEYLLYVGTVEERKNLLALVKALLNLKIVVPLVVVGKQTGYYLKVKEFIDRYKIKNVIFLNEVPVSDLPGIYQMAKLFIYPSVFEGFGIPILEALYSEVPVITSKGGCFSEAGGKYTCYVNPKNEEEIGEAIIKILNDNGMQQKMKIEGRKHALRFSGDNVANQVMELYKDLMHE